MRKLADFLRELLRMTSDVEPNGPGKQTFNHVSGTDASISLGPREFDPDHPISPEGKEDRLGFRYVANQLASSLLTQATSHGLVMSIEGHWGSGKSSLVNLLADELTNDRVGAPVIVRFEPWLVGDRDGMLVELMSDLAAAVESIQATDKGPGKHLKDETEKLAGQLRVYASQLSGQAAPIARLLGIIGFPSGELAGRAFDAVSATASALEPSKPLQMIKGELIEGLRNLSQRIVVIIDDLDRLEPAEAAEIMRLIRAVADFPNVVYVLCYDPKILGNSIEKTVAVDSGTDFLEKIVQVRFNVPQPEAFDLRRWFLEECLAFYNSIPGDQLSEDQTRRLHSVCGVEGGLLKTPRDVVRALNAIKLYWPPIHDNVDFADLVWLQMVRIENENLYSWIEDYLVEYSAISDGAIINESAKIERAKELKKYVTEGNIGSPRSLWEFKEFIPGLRQGSNIEDKDLLFDLDNSAEIASFERDRRLGSPQHSRYYFSFAKPAGALDDADLYSFISLAEIGEDLEEFSAALIQQRRPQGGTKFDLLIDRLNSRGPELLPDSAVPSILMALANCMDTAGLESGKGDWGVRWSWRSANRLFEKLLTKLAPDVRSNIIRSIFASGKAIGWLVSEPIRDEIFSHGRYGDRTKPEENRLFTGEELDEAIHLLLERFKSTDRHRILDAPEVLQILYGWKQAGDEAGVLEWVQEQLTTDAGLLKLLSGCRGWSQSDKTYYPLNRRDLKNFMDFDAALERLRGISENMDKTEDERELAKELLGAAELGEDN